MARMVEIGIRQRLTLAVVHVSASTLRYEPKPDRNVELHEQIATLAQRRQRYGAGLLYVKLRQKGLAVDYNRVERLYQGAGLRGEAGSARRYLQPHASAPRS